MRLGPPTFLHGFRKNLQDPIPTREAIESFTSLDGEEDKDEAYIQSTFNTCVCSCERIIKFKEEGNLEFRQKSECT